VARKDSYPTGLTGIAARTERDPNAENDGLRAQLQTLTAEAAKNEVILKKTQERELELLQAESLAALLRILVHGLSDSYSLDAVTLMVSDPQHDIRHLLVASGERIEDFSGVMLVDSLIGMAPPFATLRRPWLGPYSPADHELLFPNSKPLKSVALIPLLRQQRLTGVLNFGSADANRFTRQHATDFMAHLGIIAAVCLENTANRARLLRSGITDFLTGWYNRRYLHTRIKEELSRAQRQGSIVACMMIDVDHFKQVNDVYGHLAGDRVLRELAQRIDGHIRVSDAAARFGGDEFAILLPDTGVQEAVQLAERIRQMTCASPIDLGKAGVHSVSLSIGVAAVRPERNNRDLTALADRLLIAADTALYQAKGEGRDRVEAAKS
jgi:two-component system cell cycle response regulator